ncbi:heme-binding protein [Paraburkholderia elongata]|nr:heme-binding protein [Paraburkholderia elongata]
MPVAGGVLIRDSEGRVMGAVGVSGDHPEKDEACAVFGIEGACLMADVG